MADEIERMRDEIEFLTRRRKMDEEASVIDAVELAKLRTENKRLSAANERLRKENGNLRVMVETWRQTAYEHGYEDR